MRKVLILFLFSSGIAYGQVNPPKYNAQSTYSLTDTIRNYNIRERLVQLAMNNPTYEITDRLATIALYHIRIAKSAWFSTLTAQGNINEFTINPKSAQSGGSSSGYYNPSIYPKYNFGLTLPFDFFTKNTNNVKIARENYLMAQATKNDKFREIKAQVLTKYEDYLLARQKFEFQNQITQDAYTNYLVAQDGYKKNTVKEDDLNKVYRNWVTEQLVKLELQRNVNVSKIDIERLIGVKLDDVLKETP